MQNGKKKNGGRGRGWIYPLIFLEENLFVLIVAAELLESGLWKQVLQIYSSKPRSTDPNCQVNGQTSDSWRKIRRKIGTR